MEYLALEINNALIEFNSIAEHLTDKEYNRIFKIISSCETYEQLISYMQHVRKYCQ